MISIIIPVYKVEPYLRQCIDSILDQTYKDLEIILIDDGSPDRCGEICDEYAKKDSRIKVIHTENQGLSAARNVGLKNATGEYIGFVDSDDWIEPDMYEKLLKRLTETGADLSICGYWKEKGRNFGVSKLRQEIYKNLGILEAYIDKKFNSVVWNKLYKRELFDGLAFPTGKNYEDIFIMPHLLVNAKTAAYVPVATYHHRDRPDGITRTNTAGNLIDYANAKKEFYYFVQNNYPELYFSKESRMEEHLAKGISKVWCYLYGCSRKEKKTTLIT